MPLHTFTATPTINGGHVQWELCYTLPEPDDCGTTKDTYPDVELQPGQPNQPFRYAITGDNTGLDIKFAENAPLWIQRDTQPTGPGIDHQITKVGGAGTKVLTFVDLNTLPNSKNPQPVILKYQLNFTDGQGKEVTPIDPEIKNGGGNVVEPSPAPGFGPIRIDSNESLAIALAIAFFVGIAICLAFRR